ncbi:MAG: hypothetical protein AB1515_04510 [Nitrospirota bacterium]
MPVQPSLFDAPSFSARSSTLLTAARLCALREELILLNKRVPVIVSGARESAALRRLGLKGKIIRFNGARSAAAFGKRIGRTLPAVILLLDWNRQGRQVHAQLSRHLDAACAEYLYVRHEFMTLCSPAITTIDELPAHLSAQAAYLAEMAPAPHAPDPA